MIKWQRLLDNAHIEWQPGSGNNIEIACVFCGSADQGKHLSISLEGKGYHCWRNRAHSGKSPIRLLMALLKCSITEAQTLAGITPTTSIININNLFTKKIDNATCELSFPKHFKPIINKGASRVAFTYLISRGYSEEETIEIIERYDLRFTNIGFFHHRIIIPIYEDSHRLITWTGRSVSPNALVRYLSLSSDPTKQMNTMPAVRAITSCLLRFENIRQFKGRKLFVCEGPFDAIRLDYFGRDHNIAATCLFGKQLHSAQIDLLGEVRNNFDDLVFLIDKDAQLESLKLSSYVSHLDPHFIYLDSRIKDPANLTRAQAQRLWTTTI